MTHRAFGLPATPQCTVWQKGDSEQTLIADQLLPKAQQILQVLLREYQAGTVDVSDLYPWPRRIMELKHRQAHTREQRIDVVQEHRQLLGQFKNMAEQRFRTGYASRSEVLTLDYYLSEAEPWRLEAKR